MARTRNNKVPGPRVKGTIVSMLTESIREDLIVTPAYLEWLDKTGGVVSPEAAARVAELMSTPDRVRSGSFSASSAGLCYRRQELSFLGVAPPGVHSTGLQRIFNNGNWVHYKWQAELLTAGVLESVESTVKKSSMKARCTMDGIGIAKNGRFAGYDFGLEIKGRNDYTYKSQEKSEPDDKTLKQVGMQFALLGYDIICVLNENKNNQDFHEWVIYRDDDRVEDALDELAQLNRAIDRGKLHPMIDECKAKTGEFDKCPFGGVGGPCIMSGNWPAKQ